MTDMRHGEGDRTGMTEDERRSLDVDMPRERPDHEAFGREADAVESSEPIDVDEGRRRGQSHIQRGHEALPTRQDTSVGAVALEQGQGLFERGGPMIGERHRFHAGILP